VAGVMVSIAAFQAVDPGSIPGPRIFFARILLCVFFGGGGRFQIHAVLFPVSLVFVKKANWRRGLAR
jgi:hypothetical protein